MTQGTPYTAAGEQAVREELMVSNAAAVIPISAELLDEYTGMDDLIGRAFRGEIQLKPHVEPRHRCLACWLVSLLPHHDRCRHGYPGRDCACGE